MTEIMPVPRNSNITVLRPPSITSELSEMFAKSHELENEIRKKLGAIGYEI